MSRTQKLKPLWLILLIIGLLIELGCQTFWKGVFDNYTNPFVWLIGGLLAAFAALPLLGFKEEGKVEAEVEQRWGNALPIYFIFGLCAAFIGSQLYNIFLDYPPDPMKSDIVPSLQLYVRRFLSGEYVYTPMEFPGWEVHPTYFPLLWLPYIFSELLHIDYRWTAYLVFLIAILCYNRQLLKQAISPLEASIKALLPFLPLYAFIQYSTKIFGLTAELLPIGFYLLLCLTVFHRSKWLMAFGILLCLLSRYAFTFWLPMYLLFYWVEKGFKPVFRVSLYVLLGVILLYVLPFMTKDWSILQKGLGYYSETAARQWIPQPWQSEGDVPHHLNKGMSFSIYFYEKTNLEPMERLAQNRKVHLFLSLLAAGLIAAFYFFYRHKGLNTKWFLIIALKFYLTIFYGFIYVPFPYLYMLPLFMTLPLLYAVNWTEVLGRKSKIAL